MVDVVGMVMTTQGLSEVLVCAELFITHITALSMRTGFKRLASSCMSRHSALYSTVITWDNIGTILSKLLFTLL